jgi:HEAT repeat protein
MSTMKRSGFKVGLWASVVLTVCAGAARADDAAVYRLDVLGDVPVLVPRIVRLRAGATMVERTRAMFARLRKSKPHVYGASQLDLSPDRAKELEESRIATVLLDARRPRHTREVVAEVVYSFAGLGVTSVRTVGPDQKTAMVTRKDIPSAAFVLGLPFWLGLPPSPVAGGLVRLPAGELIEAEALEERLRKGDAAIVSVIDVLLGDAAMRPKARAARSLGFAPAEIAKPRLLALLKEAHAGVRAAAVDALASHKDAEISAALSQLLAGDADESVKAAAARALVESGDRAGAQQGVEFLLRAGDPARKVAILSKMRGTALEGMAERLLPLLSDADARVRAAALGALAGQRDEKILGAVAERLAKDPDADCREAAARALLASGTPEFVARGLAFELGSTDESRAVSAAQQLGGMGGVGREALETQLLRGTQAVRVAAAKALERIGEGASVTALAKAAEDGLKDARSAAETILSALAPDALGKLIAESAGYLRWLAIRAARSGQDAPVRLALIAALRDTDKVNRAAAAKALGRVGGEGSVAALLPLLEDENDKVRRAAADALGRIGDPQARASLLKQVKYGTVAVRRAVFRALSRLRGQPEREQVTILLECVYDEDAFVREYVMETLALGNKKDLRIANVVRLQLKDQVVHVRKAAVRALGKVGNERVLSNVEDALNDTAVEVRLAAVEALEALGGAKAAAALERHAGAEKDPNVASRAREAAAKVKARGDG